MAIYAIEKHRMVAGHLVDVPAARQFLDGPEGMIPTAAYNPFAGSGCSQAGANPLAKIGQRLRPRQVHGISLEASGRQVKMGIVESRHNEVPGQIDDFGVRTLEFQDFGVVTHGHNAVSTNRESLGPLDLVE